MGEKAVFSVPAHVFQIDPQTKKRWLPSSAAAVRVSYYHDPVRKTFRIIAIENSRPLINSTIAANMNFTKTSPKFGQWSDHRANTVYGLGFSTESDLQKFVEKFQEAKMAAKKVVEERKHTSKKPTVPEKTGTTSIPGYSKPTSSPEPKLLPQTSTPVPPTSPPERGGSGNEMTNGDSGDAVTQNGSQEPSLAKGKAGGNSQEAQLEALKYENKRLRVALTSSAQNVKKWENEMQTLKTNNAKLTTALKESNQHVAEWKDKLQQYKDECTELKKKMALLEAGSGAAMSREESEGLRSENEELKEVLTAVQVDLEARQADLSQRDSQLRDTNTQLVDAKARIKCLEEESASLTVHLSELEDQLKMAAVASQRKMEEAKEGHIILGKQLQEILRLHQSLSSHYSV